MAGQKRTQKTEQAVEGDIEANAVQNQAPESISTDRATEARQIKCIMIGVTVLILFNLVLSVFGVVVGMDVQTQVESIEEKIGPLVELAEEVESSGILDSQTQGDDESNVPGPSL